MRSDEPAGHRRQPTAEQGSSQAVFVEGDIEHGVMTVHRWSPRRGYSQTGRAYP
jgi:hypothetical protein